MSVGDNTTDSIVWFPGEATGHKPGGQSVSPPHGTGGGVEVDNGTDPPAAVTTLNVAGADVSTPDQATLPRGGDVGAPFSALIAETGAGITVNEDSTVVLTDANDGQLVRLETNGQLSFGSGSTVWVTTDGWLAVESLGEDPDDADIAGATMILYFDRTPGAAKLRIKAKDFNGSVVTGSVSLS